MSWSCLPRWKFTDSCGRPRASGAIHVGCTHDGHTACAAATRRAFLKTGVAIVGGPGLATVMDPREVFAQVRVFPPPPPAVSPIAGLMDTHVHSAPDVFGRSLDVRKSLSFPRTVDLKRSFSRTMCCTLRTGPGSRASTLLA
jgi:hypothetical protein